MIKMRPGMKTVACLGSLMIALGGYALAAPQGAAAFKSAIADPTRPPEDVARDADRKPRNCWPSQGSEAACRSRSWLRAAAISRAS